MSSIKRSERNSKHDNFTLENDATVCHDVCRPSYHYYISDLFFLASLCLLSSLCQLMVMILRKLGYEILVAGHGRECLEILDREAAKGRANEIEVILMDARSHTHTTINRYTTTMPSRPTPRTMLTFFRCMSCVVLLFASMDVMDGTECTRVIRMTQLPHRKRPHIIAQTANVSEEFRLRCLACGMDDFLGKKQNQHTHQVTKHALRGVTWSLTYAQLVFFSHTPPSTIHPPPTPQASPFASSLSSPHSRMPIISSSLRRLMVVSPMH